MTRACRARVCWRRLRDWQAAGAWHRLHALLPAELRAAGRLELTRAIADSAHVRPSKGPATGPSPVDQCRAGSKHHILTDAVGVPLAVTLTGGNRNDDTQLVPLLDAVHQSAVASVAHAASPACWSLTVATTTRSTGACYALVGSAR